MWNKQSPLLIAAFAGWNDAGDAATSAARRIVNEFSLVSRHQFDAEDYIDYQYYRPVQNRDDMGNISIQWPSIEIYGPASSLDKQIFVLIGPEPSRYWHSFIEDLLDVLVELHINRILFLGSMLSDAPHTRPFLVIPTTNNIVLADELDIEKSKYEGPIGIASAIDKAATEEDVLMMSIWAQIPHYVHNAPSPKGILALLRALESHTDTVFELKELEDDAKIWEEGVDIATRGDEELSIYIDELEKQRDAVDAPEASGDAIAKEFEEFLKNPGNEKGD